MDQQLADVRRHLNKEDPAVVVPQHEQEGLEEARKAFGGFIAAVAACRRRAIGTNLILLPLHNPVEIAEIGAFMDLITSGKFLLGVDCKSACRPCGSIVRWFLFAA